MAKLKIKRNSIGYEVTVKLQNQELINENEMSFFSNRLTRGFVNPVAENSRKLRYDIQNSESLFGFLKSGVKTEDIFVIIAQFLETIKKTEAMKLYLCNLILDLNYVFYRPSSREVLFIYQPLINTTFRINLFDFMNAVIYTAVLKPGEDSSLLGKFCQLLSGMERLDINRINEFIKNNIPYAFGVAQGQRVSGVLQGRKDTAPNLQHAEPVFAAKPSYQNSGAAVAVPYAGYQQAAETNVKPAMNNEPKNVVPDNVQRMPVQQSPFVNGYGEININGTNSQCQPVGSPMSVPVQQNPVQYSNMQSTQQAPLNSVSDKDEFSQWKAPQTDSAVDNVFPYGENEYDDDMGGTVLLDDDEGTVLLNDYEGTILLNESITIATLTRKKTGEKTIIDKNIFRVGTSRNLVDYIVTDNRAVSRTHADIIKKDEKYYIYDEKSTNGTYVNDCLVEKKKEYEIHSGDTVKLADEEFIFEIE